MVSKTPNESASRPHTVPVECLDRKINSATDHSGERYLVNPNRQDRLKRFDIPVKIMMEKTTFYRELLRGNRMRGVSLGRHGVVTLDLNYDVFLQICLWLTKSRLEDIWEYKDLNRTRERWSEVRDKAEELGVESLVLRIREKRLAYPKTTEDWRYENQAVVEDSSGPQLYGVARYPTDPTLKGEDGRLPAGSPRGREEGEKKTTSRDEMRKR